MGARPDAFVVTYNRPQYRSAVAALSEHGFPITVMNNGKERLKLVGAQEYHFPFNPGLARVWNWCIALAQTDWVFIQNDDAVATDTLVTLIDQSHLWDSPIHGATYEGFLLHKSLLSKVGWFDEYFTGVFWEDTDYEHRLKLAGVERCACSLVRRNRVEGQPEAPSKNEQVYHEKWLNEREPAWNHPMSFYPCVTIPNWPGK